MEIRIGNFLILFKNIQYETYDDPSYYGVIFKDDKAKYDIIHHRFDWTRLIVNYINGSWQDLPFHEGTFRFLPECVKVERIT